MMRRINMKKLFFLICMIMLVKPIFAAPPIMNHDGAKIEKLSSELWGGVSILTKPDRARIRLAGDSYPGNAVGNRDRTTAQLGQFDYLPVIAKLTFWVLY